MPLRPIGGIYVSTPDNLGLALRKKATVTGQLADGGCGAGR